MKKYFFILLVIVLFVGYFNYNYKVIDEKENIATSTEISLEEQKFNESGRAKAILDESDLWMVFEDFDSGVFIKYPTDVSMDNKDEQGMTLKIESEKIQNLEGTMGYDKETSLQNRDSLLQGEYGEDVDWPLDVSKQVRQIGDLYAQDFVVLSRFDVCDVTFERKLYFFHGDYRIILTLEASKEEIMESSPNYFQYSKENCGDELVWNFDKQEQFYRDIINSKSNEESERWFSVFEDIVKTIELSEPEVVLQVEESLDLSGKWILEEDEAFVVEFTTEEKIDYYDGDEMNRTEYEVFSKDGVDYLTVGEGGNILKYSILKLTDDSLELSYLERGNTLRYQKVK